MQRTTAFLLALTLWISLVSVLYYLGLAIAVPFPIVSGLVYISLPLITVFVYRGIRSDKAQQLARPLGCTLAIGIVLLGIACAWLSRRYGDWDAALIWNLHARFLTNPGTWQCLYEPNASGNAAYPFGLPAAVAFGWRTIGSFHPSVPFSLALFSTIGIPVVIYLQAARNNLLIGLGVLALFGLHNYYLALGLDQYADIQIAWLFLLTVVCLERIKTSDNSFYGILIGGLLGALCWMKFEGFLLAACTLIWNVPILIRKKTWLALLAGASPFALAWIVFRNSPAPPSPLTSGWSLVSSHVSDGSRIGIILRGLQRELLGTHLPLTILLLLYPLLCRMVKKPLGMSYWMIGTVLAGYLTIYLLLVTTDLEWNVRFSLPRLLLHLYPSLVFIVVLRASEWPPIRRFERFACT